MEQAAAVTQVDVAAQITMLTQLNAARETAFNGLLELARTVTSNPKYGDSIDDLQDDDYLVELPAYLGEELKQVAGTLSRGRKQLHRLQATIQ